jgi:hypothetical protein
MHYLPRVTLPALPFLIAHCCAITCFAFVAYTGQNEALFIHPSFLPTLALIIGVALYAPFPGAFQRAAKACKTVDRYPVRFFPSEGRQTPATATLLTLIFSPGPAGPYGFDITIPRVPLGTPGYSKEKTNPTMHRSTTNSIKKQHTGHAIATAVKLITWLLVLYAIIFM